MADDYDDDLDSDGDSFNALNYPDIPPYLTPPRPTF